MSTRIQLARAYDDLATMQEAGLPILRSLDIVVEGRRGRFQQIFRRLRDALGQGSTLSESMGEYRSVFGDLDRMVVEAAEAAGSMGDSLKMLAEWHEFVYRLTRRVRAGLLLPFTILHIAAFVAPFPALALGQATMGDYLMKALGILLILYVPTAIVVVLLLLKDRIPAARRPLDVLILAVPVMRRAVYQMCICRYAKAFHMLYKAGVPISECTKRATRATGNYIIARKFAGAVETVRQGGSAWEGFSRRLPAEYLHLWQIGEETGELDRTSAKIAEISGDRADFLFTHFAAWMPKFVYVIVALIIIREILRLMGTIQGLSGGLYG
jgi:general secretion pathway protein F